MNKHIPVICLGILSILQPAMAPAQVLQTAHIGYVYPAGGQVGTTFEVVVGGQGLGRMQAIHISGSGVQVKYLDHVTNYKRKMQEQLRHVGREKSGKQQKAGKEKERKFGPPPEHDMFTRLEDLSAREFRQVATKFASKEKVQRNRELDELVILEITIAGDAKPGMRELKLLTGMGGATNPVRFMVNRLPEAREHEPNDLNSPAESHMQPPFIMNGQIMPGDEDRFSFDAVAGQKLVVHAKARELVPYLADAVPGWFQAVLSLLDDDGQELAYADDFFFDPDPALLFEVPETGKYHVVIRDSIYRGREDFVYRVAVGELPMVTGIFPLGAKSGSKTNVQMHGWNLPGTKLALDTTSATGREQKVYIESGELVSNTVRYAVGSLPEGTEKEGNDTIRTAGAIKPQSTINGRIGEAGDVDFYRFKAREGQLFKVSVDARRLRSPLDSMLRVMDKDGQVLVFNDDLPTSPKPTDRTGLLTHAADSELHFTAPAKGSYYIQVTDTRNEGSDIHAYRLTLARPEPDYEVYITPSTLTIPVGSGGLATLHVRRIDGFEGPVDVSLGAASDRYSLSGGRIPAGQDSIPVVITLRNQPGADTVIKYPVGNMRGGLTHVNSGRRGRSKGIVFTGLDLVAKASPNGEPVVKPVMPADEMTQAFITHHLVRAADLTAFGAPAPRQLPSVRIKNDEPVTLSAGGTVKLDARSSNVPANAVGPLFELESAPEGIVLNTTDGTSKSTLEFTASDTLEKGLEGNLVVSVHYEFSRKDRKGESRARKVPAGYLPAIPYRTQ